MLVVLGLVGLVCAFVAPAGMRREKTFYEPVDMACMVSAVRAMDDVESVRWSPLYRDTRSIFGRRELVDHVVTYQIAGGPELVMEIDAFQNRDVFRHNYTYLAAQEDRRSQLTSAIAAMIRVENAIENACDIDLSTNLSVSCSGPACRGWRDIARAPVTALPTDPTQ